MDHRWNTLSSLVESLEKDSTEGAKAKKRRRKTVAVLSHVGAGSTWMRVVAEQQWQPRCPPGAESPDPARSRACLEPGDTRCCGRRGRVPWRAGVRERSAEWTGSLQPALHTFPHSVRWGWLYYPWLCSLPPCGSVGNSPWRRNAWEAAVKRPMTSYSPTLQRCQWISSAHTEVPVRFLLSHFKIRLEGMSLEAQWLRLCFCSREHGFDPWTGNYDPMCCVLQRKQF